MSMLRLQAVAGCGLPARAYVEDSDGTKQRRHAQKSHIDRLVHDARERMARRPDAPVSLQGLYGEVGWRKPSTILTHCLNDTALRLLYNFPVKENAIAVVMTSEDHVKFCAGRNYSLSIGEMAMMMGARQAATWYMCRYRYMYY